jgi:hypothetical protein
MLATTGGPLIAKLLPYAKRGAVWETYRRHYGPNCGPAILVAQGSSRAFNPSLPQKNVDLALKPDPEAARAQLDQDDAAVDAAGRPRSSMRRCSRACSTPPSTAAMCWRSCEKAGL